MDGELRKTGIDIISDVPWGTHLCQFYQTKEDLIDILVPYFKAGLENNEFCMWVTSELLGVEDAKTALKKAVKNLGSYINRNQIEILDASQWYTKSGKFEPNKVLQGWVEKENQALEKGFDGLRCAGSAFWLEKKDWEELAAYEATVGDIIGNHRMLAICSYPLDKCGASEVIDVANRHGLALVRRGGRWQSIESAERKRAEEALRESEERFHSMAQSANDAIISANSSGNIIFWNKAAREMFGYTGKEVLGQPLTILMPERYRDAYQRGVERIRSTGEPRLVGKITELTGLRKDGSEFPVEISLASWKVGGEASYTSIIRDITQRKRAEEALEESEQKLRLTFESIAEGIAVTDLDVNFTQVNEAVVRLHGYDNKEEMIGRSAFELIAEKDHDKLTEHMKRSLEVGSTKNVEYTFVRKDGSEFDADLSIAVLRDAFDNPVGFVGITSDIAKRRRAEEELRKFKTISDRAGYGAGIITPDGNLAYVNETFAGMHGYKVKELTGKHFSILHSEEQMKRVERLRNQLIQKGSYVAQEVWHKRKDGTVFPTLMTGTAIKDDKGKLLYLSATAVDITEREQMEQALRESEERYRTVADFAYDWECWIGPDGSYRYVSPSCERVTGYRADEFLQDPKLLDRITHPDDRPIVAHHHDNESSGKEVLSLDFRIISRNGEEHWIAHVCQPVYDNDGNWLGRRASNRDITDHKRLEEELLKMQKLESLGTLAGGIAHDFNNILAGILGNISLAKTYVEPEGKVFDMLQEAENASLRATDLTRQLLTFARGGAPIKKVTSLAELVKDSATFALRGSNLRCEFSLPDDIWQVEVDEGQISQVITNLVINADEAMPEGGTLNILAQNTEITAQDVLPLSKGKYVKITVKDHGVGIPRQHLVKIFDPYFTAKQKGSGLGLTTAYSVVKKHGGHITVKSKLNAGTTFCVYLPACEKPVPTKKPTAVEASTLGKGRILVMDDEEIVRRLLSSMLTDMGYKVELANEGAEAVERYVKAKESEQPFDAVILDLTVPGGMAGKEALGKLLEIDPSVKAIVSSGYSTDAIMAEFRRYGFRGVVAKPYQLKELRETLREIIMGTGE